VKPNPQATICLTVLAAAALSVRAGMQLVELPTLGGPASDARAVNNGGTVVGLAWLSGSPAVHHAYSYSNGVMTDLGTLGANNRNP